MPEMPRPIRSFVTARRERARKPPELPAVPAVEASLDARSVPRVDRVTPAAGVEGGLDDGDRPESLYDLAATLMGLDPEPSRRPRTPRSLSRASLSDAVIEERRGFPMPWSKPAPDPESWRSDDPLSTRESDPPEFVARVEAEARRRLGGSLEEVVPEPEFREIMYNALAEALRQVPRPVAPQIAALAARLAEHGVILTPGSGDVRDLPTPISIPGVTLSDAVIEERYGY